jgi:hypothetical protein
MDMLFGGNFKNAPARNRKMLYERMYVRILTEIATNRFKWTGMPEEIDLRFLELQLYRQALCVFFKDKEYDRYFALRGSGMGKWNMYDNPVQFTVTGNTMITKQLQAGKDYVDFKTGNVIRQACVPIWGNVLRTPDLDLVHLMATKLADVERTIEITVNNMRKPIMFAVDDADVLSMKNLWRQVTEGEPVIFGTKALAQTMDDAVKMFDLSIDKDMVLNLQIAKSKMWNETMTLLGINNANQEKKERLVSDEVSANDQQVASVRSSALGARQYAAEWINHVFDLNVSVEWNEDVSKTEGDSFAQYVDPQQSQRMEGMSDDA